MTGRERGVKPSSGLIFALLATALLMNYAKNKTVIIDECKVNYLLKGVRLTIDLPNVTSSVYSNSSPTEMPLASTERATS